MHKCPNCGRDFEGDFCPHCGEKWQEDKTCPKCGSIVSGASLYCNRCGYSFNKTPKKKTNFIGWLKSHLKIVIPVIIAVVLIIVLSCSIPACIKAKNNGTYYRAGSDGELNKQTYFVLKSGKWTDESGESGTYKTDGDKIVFYYSLFGETEELASGTIKNYVIDLDGEIYVSEKHKHSYGNWETVYEVTILNDGLQVRTCQGCGVQETKTIPAPITEGLSYTLINDGTAYGVRNRGTAKDTEIYIPKLYNGLPVVSIEAKAFYNLSSLTGITIPDSVTTIGSSAFDGCTGLTSIIISDSVTEIGSWAFEGCSGLENITIPSFAIGHLPKTNLKSVVITSGDSISDAAFYGCSELTSITIPDSVTSIGGGAFQNCSGLTSITIPDSVTEIGESAFRGCSGLTSITIPDGVTHIGWGAFEGCSELTSITIPDGVTLIDNYAFKGCSGLTSITIPDGVTLIDNYAFKGCSGLTEINFGGTMELWNNISKGTNWDSGTGDYTVHCTDGDISK